MHGPPSLESCADVPNMAMPTLPAAESNASDPSRYDQPPLSARYCPGTPSDFHEVSEQKSFPVGCGTIWADASAGARRTSAATARTRRAGRRPIIIFRLRVTAASFIPDPPVVGRMVTVPLRIHPDLSVLYSFFAFSLHDAADPAAAVL